MTDERKNWTVGMFGVTGIAVLFALVWIFGGGRRLFADEYDVSVHFTEEVIGVQEGQGVSLNGKRVGQTKAVEFFDAHDLSQGVKVVLAIDGAYDLPVGSIVKVERSIMGFGRPLIKISVPRGQATALPRDGSAVMAGNMVPVLDQILPTDMQQNLSTAVTQIGEASVHIGGLAESLSPLAKNLTRLVDPRTLEDVDLKKVVANLDSLIQRLDLALKAMNNVLGDSENQANLKASMANLRRMTDFGPELAKNLNDLSVSAKTTVVDMGQQARRFGDAIDQLSLLLTNLNKTVTMLNEGSGSAGLFLKDNRLYETLVLAVERLTKSLDEFREAIAAFKKRGLM